MTRKVSVIFGTRPEAIKLCPLILALKSSPGFETHVCVTAQHRQMLDQVLEVFGVRPDADLDLMEHDQGLPQFASRALVALDEYLGRERPDLVLVQGDTTTVFVASLAAFYRRIKIGHVEAGLRTGNKYSPFPEEINRALTTRLADYHFAPTARARENLLRESVPEDRIFVTGNTVIDALLLAVERIRKKRPEVPGVPREWLDSGRPLILITGHRRENFGAGFESICRAILCLADRFSEALFVYPVHLNPRVRDPVTELLERRDNIRLIDPLSYFPFVALMDRSTLILTDSGGIQEEAPSLGKPVLVMRNTTERPEAVEAGTAVVVGTDQERIVTEASRLLTDPEAYAAMAHKDNPFGSGSAAQKIIEVLSRD